MFVFVFHLLLIIAYSMQKVYAIRLEQLGHVKIFCVIIAEFSKLMMG